MYPAFLLTGLARGATSNFCNTVINNLAPGKAVACYGNWSDYLFPDFN